MDQLLSHTPLPINKASTQHALNSGNLRRSGVATVSRAKPTFGPPPPPLGSLPMEFKAERKAPSARGRKGDLEPMREVKILDPSIIPSDSTCLFCGPRKTGKTTSLYALLSKMKFKRLFAMCPTPEIDNTFGQFLPTSCLYNTFDPSKLDRILLSQLRLSKRIGARHNQKKLRAVDDLEKELSVERDKMDAFFMEKALRKNWTNEETAAKLEMFLETNYEPLKVAKYEALRKQLNNELEAERAYYAVAGIYDDLGNDGSLRDTIIKYVMNNGRHHMIFQAMCVQGPKDLPADCRGGLDFAFLFNDPRVQYYEFAQKHYAGVFGGGAKDLERYLLMAQSRDCSLVVRRNHSNPTFENSVFLWPRVPLPMIPKKLGSPMAYEADKMWLSESRLAAATVDRTSVLKPKEKSGGGRSKKKKEKANDDFVPKVANETVVPTATTTPKLPELLSQNPLKELNALQKQMREFGKRAHKDAVERDKWFAAVHQSAQGATQGATQPVVTHKKKD